MTTATICARCGRGPVIAIGLCRSCGLREAEAERNRRARAERRQVVQDRRGRQPPAPWPEPEEAA